MSPSSTHPMKDLPIRPVMSDVTRTKDASFSQSPFTQFKSKGLVSCRLARAAQCMGEEGVAEEIQRARDDGTSVVAT